MTYVLESERARLCMKVLVLLVIVALVAACGSRRQARQEARAAKRAPAQSSMCTAPIVGNCPSCSIACPVGQAAMCQVGEVADGSCKTLPACKCN